MKIAVFAALLVVLTSTYADAGDKPLVRVQIVYVDAAISPDARSQYVPPQNITVGNALAGFTANLKNRSVPYNVTTGTDIISWIGLTYASNGLQMAPVKGSDPSGPEVFIGPLIVMTPTIEKDDLVSIALHYSDKEVVSLPNVPSAKYIIIDVPLPNHFEAHSGSTVYLGDSFSVHGIARFAFAKVTVLPPGFPETAQPSPYSLVFIDTHPLADKNPVTKSHASATLPNDSQKSSVIIVDVTDADVSSDLVTDFTEAMLDEANRENHLNALCASALAKGIICEVIHGIHTLVVSPVDQKPLLQNGNKSASTTIQSAFLVPNGHYVLKQMMYLTAHLNSNENATIDLTVKDSSAPLPGINSFPRRWSGNIATRASQTVHNGEAIPLFPPFPQSGVNHLIFATITILPSVKN